MKSSDTIATGQQVWIMGKPRAIRLPIVPLKPPQTSRLDLGDVPLVKLGTISAIAPEKTDSYQISYQGQYNPQIGGGPIVYWSPVHRDYEILGVIKRDPRATDREGIDPKVAKQPSKTRFLCGYSIDYVVDTIKKAEQQTK